MSHLKGGEFVVKNSNANETFTPENFSEEQQLIVQTCNQFLETEIFPNLDKIDKQENNIMVDLLNKCGDLGLLGAAIPEQYGGLGEDFITGTLINETLGAGNSFAVASACHTGIGSLPILYFGSEEIKQKYLPKLATGEWKGAYCLTEPGSGSDALAAKTKAELSADGKHYILNGQKMWITNAGFADVFSVFAKIDGDKFTGFVLERGFEGISFGEEEHKMGIKGSSTRQVFFNNCKVPVENILGEIGKGHKIAFDILNIGRLKLCAATLGGAKRSANISLQYALTRQQFNLPIAKFGAIKHKLAEMGILIYAAESALYRTASMVSEMENELHKGGMDISNALLKASEEYAVECAILKVFGSEALDYVVDEGVQIHGGYGFSEEYPLARSYRDSRINRIFEGTNEINRLLSVDMLLKKAMKGELDLMTPATAVQKELMSIPDFSESNEGLLAAEKKVLANMKKAVLLTAGAAVQKLMMTLTKEQEILMNCADMLIEMYICECLLLRVEKLINTKGEAEAAIQLDILRTYMSDACEKMYLHGKHAVTSFTEGDELRMMLLGLKRFTKMEAFNTKDARRRIASKMMEQNGYGF
jgi:alkylation response protein AidB-like acyl-CoA dehydrogenase